MSCQQAGTVPALEQMQQVFGSLLSECSFSFVVSNPRAPDNPIVYASPSFFSLTGYSPAEVLGRNCRFLQGPETSLASVSEIRDAVREERECTCCLLNYKKSGEKFWNAFYMAPIRCDSGRQPCEGRGCVDYFIGLQADVTALMERGGADCVAAVVGEEQARAGQVCRTLRERAGELAPVAGSSRAGGGGGGDCAADASMPSSLLCALTKIQDCFVLADPNLPDMPIVYASPSFLRMTGYPCHEVLGRNCRFLQGPGTDPQQLAQLREALQATPPRPTTVTLLNYRKDGTPFWNCLHVAPVRDADGRVQFFAGVQLDVTAHTATDGGAAAAAGSEAGSEAAEPAAGAEEGQQAQQQAAEGGAPAPAAADGVPAVNEPSPWLLLQQKGIVGAVRVAARALSQHGLRRGAAFQQQPHHAID